MRDLDDRQNLMVDSSDLKLSSFVKNGKITARLYLTKSKRKKKRFLILQFRLNFPELNS